MAIFRIAPDVTEGFPPALATLLLHFFFTNPHDKGKPATSQSKEKLAVARYFLRTGSRSRSEELTSLPLRLAGKQVVLLPSRSTPAGQQNKSKRKQEAVRSNVI